MSDFPWACPTSVSVDGVVHDIEWDFRFGVALEMASEEAAPDWPGLYARFYLGNPPEDPDKGVDALIRFFKGPKSGPVNMDNGVLKGSKPYDYMFDADAIYASFLAKYGLDLSKDKVHWWAFRRALLSLPYESPFMRRVHYRTADLSNMGKDQKAFYQKMRKLYAIPKGCRPMKSSVDRDSAMLARVRNRFAEAEKLLNESG